jgi:DNA-directed RNA polymerase specialized sigma24 family protein
MIRTIRNLHIMSPPALRRYRAERLLRKEFLGLRSKVLTIVRSQLHAKGVTLDPADLEACYAQAWQGLYATVLGGEQVENPSAWLVLVTFRRAIDESRAAARQKLGVQERSVAVSAPGLAEKWRGAVSDPDLARELDDRAQLRQVFEGLRTCLSERECEAASLCYLQGLSRAEAAGQMGISEARMRKLMEGPGGGKPGVAGKVGGLLDTIKDGGWCEQQSSLMRAFAFGVLAPGGERHTLAMAHCRECPACRAHVASLRGLAAVLPLPLFSPFALAAGAAGAGAAGGVVGATGAGTTATGVGMAAGVGGTGWSGVAGSLTAKLAVTALVVFGAGYAVLGRHAHARPPTRRVAAKPSAVANETLSHVLSPALGAPVRGRSSTGRSSTANTRSSHTLSSHTPRFVAEAAGREFGPERVRPEAAAAPSAAAPSTAASSTATSSTATPSTATLAPPPGSAGEFGIE